MSYCILFENPQVNCFVVRCLQLHELDGVQCGESYHLDLI